MFTARGGDVWGKHSCLPASRFRMLAARKQECLRHVEVTCGKHSCLPASRLRMLAARKQECLRHVEATCGANILVCRRRGSGCSQLANKNVYATWRRREANKNVYG